MEKIGELLQKRKEKIEELRHNKINLFPNGYVVTHTVNDIRKIVEQNDVLALEEFHNNRTLFRLKRGEKRDLHFVEF